MRTSVVILIALLVVVPGATGVVTADPPHEGQDAKAGNGSDNAGHGNNCDGADSDNPASGAGTSGSGVAESAMDNRQSGHVHCPEDESQ